jgi:hypothetical protein
MGNPRDGPASSRHQLEYLIERLTNQPLTATRSGCNPSRLYEDAHLFHAVETVTPTERAAPLRERNVGTGTTVQGVTGAAPRFPLSAIRNKQRSTIHRNKINDTVQRSLRASFQSPPFGRRFLARFDKPSRRAGSRRGKAGITYPRQSTTRRQFCREQFENRSRNRNSSRHYLGPAPHGSSLRKLRL